MPHSSGLLLVACLLEVTHAETGCGTYRRKQRLHVLVGVCYGGQVDQVPVQDLLVPVEKRTGEVATSNTEPNLTKSASTSSLAGQGTLTPRPG